MEDKKILKGIRQGDKMALDHMIRRYYTTLCAFAVHIVKEQENAEDIVQELFIKIWVNRKQLEHIDSLKDYLFICIRNRSYTFLRDRRRRENRLKQISLEEENEVSSYIIEEETNRLLLESIRLLPPRSAEVIRLSLEGMKQDQIAEQMNISINTVKSLKYEAISKLRKIWDSLICLFLFRNSLPKSPDYS